MLAVVGLTLTVTPATGGGVVCLVTPAPHPATKNATRSRLQANHILLIRSNLGGILFARSILSKSSMNRQVTPCLLDARPVLEQGFSSGLTSTLAVPGSKPATRQNKSFRSPFENQLRSLSKCPQTSADCDPSAGTMCSESAP